MSIAIQTYYMGPTDNRGARIKAKLMDGVLPASVTISYPYEKSGIDVHMVAVQSLCDKAGIGNLNWVNAHFDNGYIFISTE